MMTTCSPGEHADLPQCTQEILNRRRVGRHVEFALDTLAQLSFAGALAALAQQFHDHGAGRWQHPGLPARTVEDRQPVTELAEVETLGQCA